MDPLIVNPLERFLRLNPTAVPCTGDNTAWKVPWNKMPRNKVPGSKVPEKDSAALLLFAPGFPSSCRGLRLMPAEEKQEDEEDSLSIAVLRARQQLGKGEDCDVADLFQVVKKELEGSVDKDAAAPVAPSLLLRGMVKALEEVKDSVGWGNVEEVQGDKITLKCREEEEEDCVKLSLTLSVPSDYPLSAPGVVSCDLPGGKFQLPRGSTVGSAFGLFRSRADSLRPALSLLLELDRRAWVVDPEGRPTGRDLHRTLVLRPGVTVRVDVDPEAMDTDEMPGLRLMGPESAVVALRRNLVDNAGRYNPELGLADNLERVLEVTLPRRGEDEEDREDLNVDCCVCYSFLLGNSSVPERSCDNTKCGRRFHRDCLYEYLQSNVENIRFMGTVHGACPYCEAKISCKET